MCVRVHVYKQQHPVESEDDLKSQFSPTTMWVQALSSGHQT